LPVENLPHSVPLELLIVLLHTSILSRVSCPGKLDHLSLSKRVLNPAQSVLDGRCTGSYKDVVFNTTSC
jgi:hypothetical protein